VSREFIVDAALGKNLKFMDLANRLGGNANAYSALMRLWSFTALYRSNGDLAGIKRAEIPLTEVEWQSLVNARGSGSDKGFIEATDEGVIVHDWQRSQAWILGSEKRSRAARSAGKASYAARKESALKEGETQRRLTRADRTGQRFILGPVEASPLLGMDAALEEYLDDGFLWFYKLYPKRDAKQEARKAWGRLHRRLLFIGERKGITKEVKMKIVEHITKKLETKEWKADAENRRFIPSPAVYLNQQRWED
jgi:hypothetical protein